MKKVKYLIIILMALLIPYINVFAASATFSVSSSNVHVGDSFTVKVNIYSAASWNVHVKASGPVSGCIIDVANATVNALDANKEFSASCKATGEGKITVILSGDATSAAADNADDISSSRIVTVSKKVSSNYSTNSTSTKSNSSSTTTNKKAKEEDNNKSKNNALKEIKVDGYDLTRVDNNNYALTVTNDVEKINLIATAEDSKATVTGTGVKNLNVGENLIQVIITSEAGTQNRINVKITRKKGFFIEDLDSLLKNNKIKALNITINSDTKITKKDLEKIKSSKKVVNFNYYVDDVIFYTWIIDGSKLNNTNDFLTTIKDSSNKKDMLRLSNYADGLYISLDEKSKLPDSIKLRYHVGTKYNNNDLINIYSFDKINDKLNHTVKKVKVENGYIKFTPDTMSDYLITMSTIQENHNEVTIDKKSTNIITVMLIFIIILLIVLIICVLMYKKRKRKKKRKNN